MSRKTRVYVGIPLVILFSITCISYGVFKLASPSVMYESIRRVNPEYTGYPHFPLEDTQNYAFIALGGFMLLILPFLVRSSLRNIVKQDDMDEMLREYRQRKKTRP